MAGYYYLYMHINIKNNKKYIGITCQNPKQRWNNGKGYKTCPFFYNAILKYGWDNFYHIVLKEGLTKGEAEKYEQFYITKIYKTNNPNFGYNIQNGGNVRRMSNKEKEKRKETKGINNKRNKVIYQYDLEGNFIQEFYSLENAKDFLMIKNTSHISQCCCMKRKKAYGYQWRYKKYNNIPKYERHRVQSNKIREKISNSNKKRYSEKIIIAKDNYNNIYEFINRAEAINWLKKIKNIEANFDSIKRCINGKRKSCYAMTWRYKDEWFN